MILDVWVRKLREFMIEVLLFNGFKERSESWNGCYKVLERELICELTRVVKVGFYIFIVLFE